jgi:hypothetical protein
MLQIIALINKCSVYLHHNYFITKIAIIMDSKTFFQNHRQRIKSALPQGVITILADVHGRNHGEIQRIFRAGNLEPLHADVCRRCLLFIEAADRDAELVQKYKDMVSDRDITQPSTQAA